MDRVFEHFWLVALAVMLVNLAIARRRMRSFIVRGAFTEAEANRFCIGAAVVFTVTCGLFEIVTLRTGVTAHCYLALPIAHRALLPMHALFLAEGAVFLVWLWLGGGDETLAKFGPVFSRRWGEYHSYTPRTVRLWLTGLMVVAWGGHVAMRLTLPAGPPVAGSSCPPALSAAANEGRR